MCARSSHGWLVYAEPKPQQEKSFHHNLCTVVYVFTCRSFFVYEDVFLYKSSCYASTHPTIKVYHHKLNKHRKEFKLAFKLWCACVRSESAVLLHSAWHTQLEYLGSSQLHSEPADEKKSFHLDVLCKSYANLRSQLFSVMFAEAMESADASL